jgi:hypothetical protein
VEGLIDQHSRQVEVEASQATSEHDASSDNTDDDDVDDASDGPLIVTIDHVCVTFGTTKSYKIDLLQP